MRTYKVGAEEVLVAPGWSISDKVNSRSTLDIRVVDKLSATLTEGASITIYSGDGAPLVNILGSSGSFASDTDLDGVANDWNAYGVTPTWIPGVQSFVATAQWGQLTQSYTVPAADTYYACAMVKSDSVDVYLFDTNIGGGVVSHSGSGNYELLSCYGVGDGSGAITMEDSRTTGFTQVDVKEVYVINTTTLGGITSKAQMDALIISGTQDLIWSGIIKSISLSESCPGYLEYSCKCDDNSALADKRLAAEVYESVADNVIVADLITKYLAADGVSAGTITAGITVTKAVYNYIKVSECLDYLCKLSGYNWYIDSYKTLHYMPTSARSAPFTLDDNVEHFGFTQSSDMAEYRNTQYLRGGRGETAPQSNEVPTPAPDGKSKTFVLRYPLAKEPVISINLNGAGWVDIASSDVGINGIDKDKKWYFTYNSATVTQDDSETALVPADAIRISYTGLRNIFTVASDPDQVSQRAAVEGNSGIYEYLSTDSSIKDSEQSRQYCASLINIYANIRDTISFTTRTSGLAAGMMLSVNKPLFGISDTYLIDSVSVSTYDQDTLSYQVSALDGVSLGGWESYFKSMLKQARDAAIQDNEVILRVVSQAEQIALGGVENVAALSSIYPADTLYPSDSLYPGVLLWEVNIYD